MTDGDATWTSSDLSWLQTEKLGHGCMSIFTYALGSGISIGAKDNLKQMACQNNGMYHQIADGGNLADEMSSYYNYFASGTALDGDKKVRWVLYNDAVTGAELFGACSSAFDYTVDPPKLIGVTCMDVNMLADIPTLKAQPSWTSFVSEIVDKTTECNHVKFSEDQLEELRRRRDVNSVCGASGNIENIFACADDVSCPAASINNAFPRNSKEMDTGCGYPTFASSGGVIALVIGAVFLLCACGCVMMNRVSQDQTKKPATQEREIEIPITIPRQGGNTWGGQQGGAQYGAQPPSYGAQQAQYGAQPAYDTAAPVYANAAGARGRCN